MITRDRGRELHDKTSLCLQISQQWQARPALLTSLTTHRAKASPITSSDTELTSYRKPPQLKAAEHKLDATDGENAKETKS